MAVLHILCGKIAAGKSTLATKLGQQPQTLVLAEDTWLAALFGDEMQTPRDFVRRSTQLRAIMGPHIVDLLRADLSVVLDFQANTRDSRAWMRTIIEAAAADHQLHLLMPPDEVCLARLKARNAGGAHPFEVSEAQFHAVSGYFVPPQPDEGFTIIRHS